jgi:S-methylmethionine-dependent homocysteine/selenocysteine methylase
VAAFRHALPQLEADVFLADGGIGTTLVYEEGLRVPDLTVFTLYASTAGRDALDRYYDAHARIAVRDRVGVVLGTATWRANPDWGARLGYDTARLARVNCVAVDQLVAVRGRHQTPSTPIVISGCIGPRGDAYRPGRQMTVDEATSYHSFQVRAFAATDADLVTATTMPDVAEAIGIAEAAQHSGMPVALSFTVETDGSLPTGQSLRDAIETVDDATGGYPAYYMINCAHPDHFARVLEVGAPWTRRIRGLRANASRKSHDELDHATEIDPGDPTELAMLYRKLLTRHPHLVVLGGCCGTNHRHIDAISNTCVTTRSARP